MREQVRKDPVYCKHVVAFIDHLGQRDRLRRLALLPNPYDSERAVQMALKDSAGHVKFARDSFRDWFQTLLRQPQSPNLLPRQLARSPSLRFPYDIVGFSDSIVISAPVSGIIDRREAAYRLLVFLFSVAAMMLKCLSHSIPLRAGIDVGDGLRGMFPREVYGPVLLKAYELESKSAKYPRAAIGRGLLDYLDLLETPPVDELTRDMVERCRALIYVDQDDGIKMLHVLSKTIVKRLDVTSHRAYEWVSQQQKRFHSCGNKKMITYYGRLMNYFRVHGYNDIRAAAVLSTMGEGSGDT